MSDRDLIHAAMALLAERNIDVTPLVYQRFFVMCPEAKQLFSHAAEAGAHGRMILELFQWVSDLQDEAPYLPTVIETLRNDHHNWGVTARMYRQFLAAFLAVLADTLGADWSDDQAAAWRRQLGWIQQQVD